MDRIAIIGLSCLFPGARTPAEFWRNLLEQKDSRTRATEARMGIPVESCFDPRKGSPDKFYCMHGGYIHDFEMDPSGFGIPAERIQGLDEVFQWSLHVAREALRDSGYWGRTDRLSRCGIILGNLSFPTKSSNRIFLPIYHRAVESCVQRLLESPSFRLAPFSRAGAPAAENGRIAGYPAALVADALSLSDPCFAMDAACASSLYSVKLACDYLRSGKADMMLAGAVSAADPLFVQIGFSIFQAYPEQGQKSSPLDKHSAGLIAGEGAGMFVLKRYADAVRDGDRVHAVLLGIGLSNDGRGQSVLSPNMKGQILAFERAYASAQVHPRTIQYVECHATGTSLGDKVELNSMDAFFGKYGASPMAGSVKSNLGHLLTAAGMASMTKVILSMEAGVIPATIHLEDPQTSANHVITADRIPASSVPWPETGSRKRAAVSAFGLGGTNAHLILEEGEGGKTETGPASSFNGDLSGEHSPAAARARSPMAIIAMEAHFGTCPGLSAFHRTVYEGIQHFIPLPPDRWKGLEALPELLQDLGLEQGKAPRGAYMDSFELDFMRFKIPPNEEDRLIPQQLLALRVADDALRQTRIEPGSQVAVVVAMESELALHQMRGRVNLCTQFPLSLSGADSALSPEQKAELEAVAKDSVHTVARVNQYTSFIGNIMASRIAAVWDFTGPAFTLSSEENSTFRALEVAQMILETGEAEAVVVGAVDLAGGVESVLWRNRQSRIHAGVQTVSFDQDASGWTVGEGAGAVVLKRLDKAREDGDRIYAVVDAIGFAKGVSQESVETACRRAFEEAGIAPAEIGYLEASGSGVGTQDDAEMAGLLHAYSLEGSRLRCALGNVKANIGHTFAASGMAGLLKAALCLYHRFIPQTPGWSAPKWQAAWAESPFYVPTESRTWFPGDASEKRIAAISVLGHDGFSAHLILSEEPDRNSRPNTILVDTPFHLLPVCADGPAQLEETLAGLRERIAAGADLSETVAYCLDAYGRTGRGRYGLAVLGSGRDDVLQEIEAARAALPNAFAAGKDWQSPRGSCLTARPLGQEGKIAFVYPGGFNSYVGLGRDLFQLFPQIYEEARRYSSRLGGMIAERLLYPRSLHRLSAKDLSALERTLLESPIAMFESGIMFAILYTKVLRGCFGVEPHLAIGYSMGEVSMMYALGVWDETDRTGELLHSSPVFRTRLAGPMETVREAWNLPGGEVEKGKIWYSYALRASEAEVQRALEGESRAYLTFINSPREVVIAGEEQACKRVIERLRCEHFELPASDVMHCEIVRSEYDALTRLHTLPARPVPGIDFYSADRLAPIPIDTETVARNIATIYCRPIHFPSLVRQAHADGARVFIELGPRENCTNWITEILEGQAHLAVGTNRKGADDKTSILRALARLYSHGLDIDLSPLCSPQRVEVLSGKSLIKAERVGGARIPDAIVHPANLKRFRPASSLPAAEPSGRLPEPDVRTASPEATAPFRSGSGRAASAPSRAESKQQGAPAPQVFHRVAPAFRAFHDNLSLLCQSHSSFLKTRREGLRQIGEMIQIQTRLAAPGETPYADAKHPISSHAIPWRPAELPEKQGPIPRETLIVEEPPKPAVLPEGRPVPIRAETLSRCELLARYPAPERGTATRSKPPGVIWDYNDLREFAEGGIAGVFGEKYRTMDTYRRRVRLPMEPYLLVTRVTQLDAETGAFTPSSMTTEYDIPRNAWYSIAGQIPWAVAVESGQCDLLLISYLGIDFECKGERVYRLLDCTLTFLEDVPREGDTLRYDIRINSFARSGSTVLFFFSYDCFVKDKMVLKMRGGCAGFFTDEELEAGKGIIQTDQELKKKRKILKKHVEPLLTCEKSAFGRQDLLQLVRGEKAGCFGPAYEPGRRNASLHFTAEEMLMLDRVVSLDPRGGAWGLGLIVAEKDLAPHHWYFPCHFKDDQVLAGSLMADGCGQLLRFYMLYLGLQTLTTDAQFQPLPGLPQKVRCRGQVTPKNRLLTYRMEIKEIGTTPRPYAVADVDILLQDKVVVDFKNLGVFLAEKDPEASLQAGRNRAQAVPQRPSSGRRTALFTRKHLEEFATGSIARCFGPDFAIYENRQPPRTPNGDLQLISRVLEVSGKRLDMRHPAAVVAEYDVPRDAWYFKENSHPAVMPYSIWMEISLQPCGFISAYVGTTLLSPDVDFCFRNLDGEGTILRDIDLRGRTITNRSELLSTVSTGSTIIQQFRFELSHQDDPFYRGTATFGYFLKEALANQIGMDGGRHNHPLLTLEYLSGSPAVQIDLKGSEARERLYQAHPGKPYYRLAGARLDFLDEVRIVEHGGKYGKGYIYGGKRIDPSDWFYPCHFYQDPVMPGSLGVESILQAMQIFALHQDVGRPFQSPRFVQRLNHRVQWKYRGQLIPADDQMALDVHIKGVERAEGAVMISGEASLWKNKIRIYEITDAAFCLEESSPNEGGQE